LSTTETINNKQNTSNIKIMKRKNTQKIRRIFLKKKEVSFEQNSGELRRRNSEAISREKIFRKAN